MPTGKDCYLRFLAGEDAALEDLLRLYRDGLILYVNTITHNLFDAQDVVQDVFVKLCLKKPRYRDEAGFKTWLYTIARNKAIDCLRKKKPSVSLGDVEFALQEAEQLSVEEAYLTDETRRRLRAAVASLKPDYAQVLFLTYFENLSNRQTAKIMHRSVHSVETLNHRARQALKHRLEEEEIL